MSCDRNNLASDIQCLQCLSPWELEQILLSELAEFFERLITADRTDITVDRTDIVANQLIL